MKAIIAGGRTFCTSEDGTILAKEHPDRIYAEWWLVDMLAKYKFDFVLCGGANGADELGRLFAIDHSMHGIIFKADWQKHGKAAGPMRNERMAKEADLCLLFPGGIGTDDMERKATSHNVKIEKYSEWKGKP